jgi:outer membrane receptor protein involved in Fe transport
LAVNQTMLKKLSLAWLLQYQQRAGTYTDYREIASGSEKSYEPVLTLDGRFSFQHKALGLFADVSNAFNNSYYDHGGVPQPGRLFSIGLTYRLL